MHKAQHIAQSPLLHVLLHVMHCACSDFAGHSVWFKMNSDYSVESFVSRPRVRKHAAADVSSAHVTSNATDLVSVLPKRNVSARRNTPEQVSPPNKRTKLDSGRVGATESKSKPVASAKSKSAGRKTNRRCAAKSTPNTQESQQLRKGDIPFPPFSDLKVVGDPSSWKWAEKYLSCLRKASADRVPNRSVQLFTEFTGSACAEVCTESVGALLECDVRCVSAADINAQCRSVIMSSRGFLSDASINVQSKSTVFM